MDSSTVALMLCRSCLRLLECEGACRDVADLFWTVVLDGTREGVAGLTLPLGPLGSEVGECL